MATGAGEGKRSVRAQAAAPPREAPQHGDLGVLRQAAMQCRACHLWRDATQTVFGEGPSHARLMLVGEQPGDREDLQGHPFVGPAGQLLERALDDAGIDRGAVYLTNSVKHFKFEQRGKRRLHKKPVEGEIVACHQWLERELALVKPALVVALGATAARALLGAATPVEANRGRLMPFGERGRILITVHPSFLLRMPGEARAAAYARFVADLALAAGA
ncbi:MAG TPA: UdgX family uracil-DNA binding protein [Noviherbaspirillum sp.]|jgi:DNA polymerase|uniref:UdgX family uracil-DNA binding protein n=1 Tax=Noviherbaspirillum sp. TaxID=1926288 RepID=UPI002F9398A1